jgi:type IV secretory pathway VirB4 component
MWLREYRKEHHRLSELIYWDCLDDAPGVVLQKDNSLLAVIQFRGPDLASSVPAELVAYAARLNNLFRRFPGGWGLFSEAQRREVCTYPEAEWPEPVSRLVDGERRRHFLAPGRHYETSTYLTLVYAKPRERVSTWRMWLYENLPTTHPDAHTLAYFQDEVHRTLDLLRDCCPEAALLTAEETRPGYSPLLTYLHSTVSPKVHPVGLPAETGYLDSGLTDTDMYTGLYPSWGDPDDPLTFQGYIAAIALRRYPKALSPGILETLNALPMAYRSVIRYLPLDTADAVKEIYKYRRKWLGASKRASTLLAERVSARQSMLVEQAPLDNMEEASEAQAQVEHGEVSFGYTTHTIVLWDTDFAEVGRKVKAVEAALNTVGCIAKVEDLNAFAAWRGTIPGEVYSNVRRPLLHSHNLAHLFPATAPWGGPERNEHLDGPPLLRTTGHGHTPFNLDTYDGDVGMAYIAGPIGSGKSTLLATMVMQWLKYPGAEVKIFDTGQSLRCATYAVGGHWYDVAAELEHQTHQGQRLDDRETKPWGSPWMPPPQRWQCFELGNLLKTPEVLAVVMRPLLQTLKDRMTGVPTLFVFDEGHLYLSHDVLVHGIDDYTRGFRKLNGAVIFATQSIADAARSQLAPIISDSSMTRIYLANYHALERDTAKIYKGWGINPRELTIIAGMTPKRDYYYQGRQGHRLFQLHLGPVGLAFAGASRKEDLAQMATLYQGNGVQFAVDWLHARGLHQDADYLKSEGVL